MTATSGADRDSLNSCCGTPAACKYGRCPALHRLTPTPAETVAAQTIATSGADRQPCGCEGYREHHHGCTKFAGADRPTLRDQPEHVVFTAIQQASWARGVAMLDSDVAAFAKRVLEDLLPVVERAKADAAAEALEEAADVAVLLDVHVSRLLATRAAALRSQGGGK